MGHRGRMADEALHATKRLGKREVLQILDKCANGGLAPLNLETQRATETRLLARCDVVPRMVCEAWTLRRS